MSLPAFCSSPVPEVMAKAGLSWPSVIEFARKVVATIQAVGDTAIDLAEDGFKAWAALSGKDWSALFAAFADGQRNAAKIIAAVKAEFGLE